MPNPGFIAGDLRFLRSPVLDLHEDGRRFRFRLLTAHLDEEHVQEPDARPRHEHRHPVYHVVMYAGGINRFLYDGAPRVAHPGVLVLAGPDTPHCFPPLDTGVVLYHELTFDLLDQDGAPAHLAFPDLLARYAGAALPAPPCPLALDRERAAALDGLFRAFFLRFAPQAPTGDLQAALAVLDIFRFLAGDVLLAPDDARPARADPLLAARERLDLHYAEDLPLAALAAGAGLSPAHFCRAFRRRFGLPPLAYRLRRRVEAAGNLLRHGNQRCKEVAEAVGFADPYHFSKAFRRELGLSPSAWRRAQSMKSAPDSTGT